MILRTYEIYFEGNSMKGTQHDISDIVEVETFVRYRLLSSQQVKKGENTLRDDFWSGVSKNI